VCYFFPYNLKIGKCVETMTFSGIIESTFFMPALFLTIILYLLIIKKFRKVRKQISSMTTKLETEDDPSSSTDTILRKSKNTLFTGLNSKLQSNQQNIQKKRDRTSNGKERRVVLNMIIVFSLFLACWSPLCFLLIGDYWFRVPGIYYRIFMSLGISNSAMNVFIYAAMNSQFRQAYLRVLKCRWTES